MSILFAIVIAIASAGITYLALYFVAAVVAIILLSSNSKSGRLLLIATASEAVIAVLASAFFIGTAGAFGAAIGAAVFLFRLYRR
jgi:hypothetical protein